MNHSSCKDYCLQHHRYPRIKKPEKLSHISLILFDMDGVLVDTISSWKFIHQYYNMNNDASVKAYVKGEIDDLEFIRRDVSLWMENSNPITTETLELLFSKMPLMPGAKKCFDWIHQHNISTAIISAGIKTLATIVSKKLGITYVYANELLADDNGYLTGEGIVEVPLKQKDQTVLTIHKKMGIPFEEMVAVGNSCYDIPMLLSVGLAVVFHPADECVRDYADEIINEKDLSVLKQVLINYQY